MEEQSASIDQPGLLLQKFAIDSKESLESIKELLDEIIYGIKE
ncbi:hypothetical protein [Cryomorpha ignava]|nr:hypothetical protein [Cryomorpha ignava]